MRWPFARRRSRSSQRGVACRAGLGWSDPRDSITISDLKTDTKLWNWGRFSSPTKQDLRLNLRAFWREEIKAMRDLLADRIVGPRLGADAAGEPPPSPPPADAVPPPPPPAP